MGHNGAVEKIIIRNSRLTISKYYFVREMQLVKKKLRYALTADVDGLTIITVNNCT
jgi:hypothetical protein